MKLGIQTIVAYKPGEPLAERDLVLFKGAGINSIEVHGTRATTEEPGNVHFDYHDRDYVRHFAELLKKLSVKAHSIHLPYKVVHGFDPTSEKEDSRNRSLKELKCAIEAMEVLGGDTIVVHPQASPVDGSLPREERLNLLKVFVAGALEDFSDRQFRIAVENSSSGAGCIGDNIRELKEVVDEFHSSRVGICLDTGHANTGSESLPQWVETFGDRIFALHVHDNDGTKDSHDIPFRGTINWHEFAAALERISYNGPFLFEVIPDDLLSRKKSVFQILEEVKEAFFRIFPDHSLSLGERISDAHA